MDDEPDDRPEVHNANVDEGVARAHLCGMTDLRSGRTCIRPARHPGPCAFVSKEEARDARRDS
ncbi:MAG: hypothetical protein ACRDZQ_05905 [Acidimicrobiales bacterium]